MLDQISSRQLAEWEAYFRVEQLGDSPEWRADVRSAVATSNIVNLFAKKPTKPDDMMPKFSEAPDADGWTTDEDGNRVDPSAALRARMIAYARRKPGSQAKKESHGRISPRETES